MSELAKPVFGAYDRFLTLIDEPGCRRVLETIDPEAAKADDTVAKAHRIGREFGQAIESFFFDQTSRYAKAIRSYGVF